VEPLREYQPLLERLVGAHPRITYVMAAAGESSDERCINVHPDLVGSSLYREVEEGSGVNGSPRCIPTVTVDELVKKSGSAGPFLLKADVQGAELDVLRGADKTLQTTDYVLLEVSFFKFFSDGPECCDVLSAMKERGFVPYEICSFQYRPLDNALSQVDIAFVRESGLFRRQHHYATPEQRARQNEHMQAELRRLFS
jgi:FkbM family methyltransferase